ncbi:hypothetical protein [Microbacterium sp. KNMS]
MTNERAGNVREALAGMIAPTALGPGLARAIADAVLSRFDVTPKGQAPADVAALIAEALNTAASILDGFAGTCLNAESAAEFVRAQAAYALERASQPVTEEQVEDGR